MQGRMKALVMVLGSAAVLLVAGGVVLAHTVPVTSGVIHTCVNGGGQLKIIGANDTCPGTQTSLDWNAIGPQGPTGSTGPVSGWEIVDVTHATTAATVKTTIAICPGSKKVVGGGARVQNSIGAIQGVLIGSFPTGSGNGGIVEPVNASNPRAFAICANVTP